MYNAKLQREKGINKINVCVCEYVFGEGDGMISAFLHT